MFHEKNLKSSNDQPRCTRAPAPGGGVDPASTTAAPERGLPALPPPPITAWPWWAHMDPSFPDALLTFLEMRLRHKYLQDRRPVRCLINDGTQTDDVPWPLVDAHSSRSPERSNHFSSELSDAHCSTPLESTKQLTGEQADPHSSRQLESLEQHTSEPPNTHSSRLLQSPKQLTNELANSRRSKPLEIARDLTSGPAVAHVLRPLESLKHLTSEMPDNQRSRPLQNPKHLPSEPGDAQSSRPIQSLKKLISELIEAHSSIPLESLKHFTKELVDTHISRQSESLKHLVSEPADAHSSRPFGSPKHLPSKPTDTHSSRSLGSSEHFISDPSDTQTSRPLESLTHPTNEPPKARRLRALESPKHFTSVPSDTHTSRPLGSQTQLTNESANAHSLRALESPKHFTSEAADTHCFTLPKSLKHLTSVTAESPRSRLVESLKHFTNELTNAHSSRQRKSPTHLNSQADDIQSLRPLESLDHPTSRMSDAHNSRPLESPKHLTSEHPQSGDLGQHHCCLKTDECDKLRDSRHSASSALEDKLTKSDRRVSPSCLTPHTTQTTSNQQSLVQNSLASTTTRGQWQETERSQFATPRMEAAQSQSLAISSHISTTRTFSMKGGEWFVEQESSTSKVNPDAESNRNYPSTDRNINQMLIHKALNSKPQNIFQKLFRFQSKSSVNSDTSNKCSLPFDVESTARKDFNLGNSTCKIPTENTCKNDFLKVEKDLLIYTFKDTDKGIFYPDFNRGRSHTRGVDFDVRVSHRRSRSRDELRCIYFNRAASYSSLAEDLFDESDSSSSDVNLFFTTMNFGTSFSDAESSSGSASSSYSPRRTIDREECIDLRSALASENLHIEKTEEVLRKQNAQVPVWRTRCQHTSVRPLPFNDEQHRGVSTVTVTTATKAENYCEIHDSVRERFEIEFLKKAVSRLFDMNPEQLKGDNESFPVLVETTATATPSTSRRSPACSPRTSINVNRKTTQSTEKQSDEGIFARAWRNVMRLVQRKMERTQDSSPRAGSERTVQSSCATLSSGKCGTKASDVKDRDSNPDGTFTTRVTTLPPIDEVPETTTSGSSAFGTGRSSSEISTSNRRKM